MALSRARTFTQGPRVPYNSVKSNPLSHLTAWCHFNVKEYNWDLFWAETHPPSEFGGNITSLVEVIIIQK